MTDVGSFPYNGQPVSQEAMVLNQMSLNHGGGPLIEETFQLAQAIANAVQPPMLPFILVKEIV